MKTMKKLRFSIRFTVVSIFILSSLVTASVAIGLQYYFNKNMARESALEIYDLTSRDATDYIKEIDRRSSNIASLMADNNDLLDGGRLHQDALKVMAAIMEKENLYYSLYVGFPNGDLEQLVNVKNTKIGQQSLNATDQDRWVSVSITGEGENRRRYYRYMDSNFVVRAEREEPSQYYANKRIWYKNASSTSVYHTPPYLFAQLQLLGQTYSAKVPNSEVVFGIDITLNAFSELLKKSSTDSQGNLTNEVYVFNEQGFIIASSLDMAETLKKPEHLRKVPYPEFMTIAHNSKLHGKLQSYNIEGQSQYIYVQPLKNSTNSQTFFAIIVPETTLFSASMDRVKKSILITVIAIIILLPLSWPFSTPIIHGIRLLSLESIKIKHRQYSDLKPVKTHIKELHALGSSMLDMSTSIQQYQQSQKELMDSFIQLIAQAIDEKSPYTAGHCNRVPELGLMLADAAQRSTLPPFDAFKFNNEDEYREFRIAAWLHDCGKITTPEHIVDKGSKLEVIYNRIHEIRMRFEVLWRDAELAFYKKVEVDPSNKVMYQQEMKQEQQQLIEEFAFVADANVGGEFMSQEDIDRLHLIANKTWLRHFDDRLGLSPAEELHLGEQETETLPVVESLLSDKKKHIVKRERKVEYHPDLGIKMDVPEYLYNQGELYNLSIQRGTLTNEDRFKINQHIISTITMLETLPFPPELSKVPRYASTHHETLKGTGYPRKLTSDDLSIPEHILVVSDIFEALTAADRPYKKAKPVSVAIDILYKMALDNHLDMDTFRLLLTSGVYLDYAKKFLAPEQIDEVDIEKYLS